MLSSSATLQKLHWLPLQWLIKFKLASLTHKALQTGTSSYLTDLLHPYLPVGTPRSSNAANLHVPRINLTFSSRSFHILAQIILNSLPLYLFIPNPKFFPKASQNSLLPLCLQQPLANQRLSFIYRNEIGVIQIFYLLTCLLCRRFRKRLAPQCLCSHKKYKQLNTFQKWYFELLRSFIIL